jgi:hypothetical protein
MKKIIYQSFLIGLLFFFPTDVFSQTPACPPIGGITFSAERVIDTSLFVKSATEVQLQEKAFEEHFMIRGQQLDYEGETVSMKAFLDALYCPIATRMANDPNCTNRRCVAAVKISHGLSGNKMRVLYQPLYLKLDSIVPYKLDSMYYHLVDSLQTYEHRVTGGTGNFHPLNNAQANAYKLMYKRTVLKKLNSTDITSAINLQEFDTRGVIFSFQEIVMFYHLVYEKEPNLYTYSRQIKIRHGGTTRHKKLLSDSDLRHTLFITRPDVNVKTATSVEKVLAVTSEDDGANLAHLCPPRCSNLSYPSPAIE